MQCLKKRKGQVVRNLYVIQLIKADLKLLIRILVNERNRFKIENNIRVSKANCWSRLHYYIENIILEKRLVYDNSILLENKTVYNITDLQSYYGY